MDKIIGFRVAILVDDGFEQSEMAEPRKALQQAGAQTHLISPQNKEVRAWQHQVWGDTFPVDVPLDKADPGRYDGLLLPGGVMNPDHLRMRPNAVAFVKAFFDDGKPVAAICHGPWMVLEAGGASGRKMTSWPSLKTDLKNAGAQWVDEEVAVDNNLITSRKPDDIPAFNREMIAVFSRVQESRSTHLASGLLG